MTGSGNHIINRVVYHVHGVPVNKAFSFKEQDASYIKGGFSKKLQALFDKYFPGEDNIHIDKLQLDITLMPGEIDLNKYGNQLLELLEKQLQKKAAFNQSQKIIKREEYDEQKLKGIIQNKGKENYAPADAFIFFLEKGYLPWWCKITRHEEFEQQLLKYFSSAAEEEIKLIVKRIVKAKTGIIYRFIHQFSDNYKFQFAAVILKKDIEDLRKIYYRIITLTENYNKNEKKIKRPAALYKINLSKEQTNKAKTAFIFWNLFLQGLEMSLSFEYFEKQLEKIIERIIESTAKPKVIDTLSERLIKIANQEKSADDINLDTVEASNNTTPNEKGTPEYKEDAPIGSVIFINNAGLVLLHPFIALLFNNLNITLEEKIVDYEKAITVLNYLCGYKEMQPEFEWPLLKILCGMEISETVVYLFELSDADKLECNALLQQVIDYWIALKQTSAEGLQQTFLQRFGKLSKNESGWLLQVEQKTVDILKDRLPWGVSMCKLPWMREVLTVEW